MLVLRETHFETRERSGWYKKCPSDILVQPLQGFQTTFVPFSLTTFCPTFLRWTNMSAAYTNILVQSILLHFPTICTNDILSHIPELDQYVGSMHDILVQFPYIPSLPDNVYQRHSVPRFIRNIDLGKISTVELLVN
ncbi:hypothetical protein LSTR_LSTR010154 [Laodelphax striatellus]|uniref:Uncharacterized protein n=1 Tax=Laodelphax striatellus TaxID=195883 RepID=A0A482WJ63_LAOST|nr:hypothetical protein LSTR_LSTR010154 [Laodelphax striatellus]